MTLGTARDETVCWMVYMCVMGFFLLVFEMCWRAGVEKSCFPSVEVDYSSMKVNRLSGYK